MCDIANRILNEDDIDYFDSECDFFPCKGKYAHFKQHFSRSRRKKKKTNRSCMDPHCSSCSFNKALKPTRGVRKKRIKHQHKRLNDYRYPNRQRRKKHKHKRLPNYSDSSIFSPDECECQYSNPKQAYRQSQMNARTQKNAQNKCLVCPLDCPYHAELRQEMTQRKPRKRRRKPKLSYSQLVCNDKFAPDFAFGRRKAKGKRPKAPSKRHESCRNSYEYRNPYRRRQKHVNPFLSDSRQHYRTHRADCYNV